MILSIDKENNTWSWNDDEFTGSYRLTHSKDERAPQIEIEWDGDIPDDYWESIEEKIEEIVFNNLPDLDDKLEEFQGNMRLLLEQLTELVRENLPMRGNISTDCQRTNLIQAINEVEYMVSGTQKIDFVPNEFSK